MWEAIVLGVIQGLTEFLPVSSSGHLVLANHFFGISQLDPAYNVFVQGGTVLSLIVYFAPKLNTLKLNYFYLRSLFFATIPALIAGFILKDKIEIIFSSLTGVAIGFLLTTIFLIFSQFHRPKTDRPNLGQSLAVGLAQAFAILPGLSRSGSTISTALLVGVKPEEAFNFSFLMSIPVVAGASLISAKDLSWNATLAPSYIIGFFVASITGYYALTLLDKIILKGKFYLFAPYTLLLAIVTYLIR